MLHSSDSRIFSCDGTQSQLTIASRPSTLGDIYSHSKEAHYYGTRHTRGLRRGETGKKTDNTPAVGSSYNRAASAAVPLGRPCTAMRPKPKLQYLQHAYRISAEQRRVIQSLASYSTLPVARYWKTVVRDINNDKEQVIVQSLFYAQDNLAVSSGRYAKVNRYCAPARRR